MEQELIEAARDGNLEKVVDLINRGAGSLQRSHIALRAAAERGYIEIVRFFIDRVQNPRARHYLVNIALESASSGGQPEIVRFLLGRGADVNSNDGISITLASRSGNIETVSLLIQNGADVSARDNNAIYFAVREGHIDIVRLLLDNGANVNPWNHSLLSEASRGGYVKIVKLLLQRGAKINDKAIVIAYKKRRMETAALLWAFGGYYPENFPIAEILPFLNPETESLYEQCAGVP